MQDTEKIKEALATVLAVAQSIQNAMQDKKISFVETLGIAAKAFPIVQVIRNADKLIQELKDLDTQERAQLATWLNGQYNIPNERAEETVKLCIDMILHIVSFSFALSEIWK